MLLNNKTAVITGTNRGIGKSILELFAKNNCNVFACSRKPSAEFSDFISSLSSKFDVEIEPVYFDLDDQNSIKDAANFILSKAEKITILPFILVSQPEISQLFVFKTLPEPICVFIFKILINLFFL